MGKARLELTGKKFGKWTVIEYWCIIKNNTHWKCKCDCGTIRIVNGMSLVAKASQSCGCVQKEFISKLTERHGESRKGKATLEYVSWMSLKNRCNNKKGQNYKDYGGRGITVCDRWMQCFENFLEDMGRRPTPQHSIDRIENDKGYYKENCRWATGKVQTNNARSNVMIEYNGERMTASQWDDRLGFKKGTVWNRHYRGWDIQRIITQPIRKASGRFI